MTTWATLLSVVGAARAEFLVAWGANSYGQYGDGTTTAQPYAYRINSLDGSVQYFGAGNRHGTYMLNGTLLASGANTYGQLGIGTSDSTLVAVALPNYPSHISALSVGGNHTLVIDNGGVFAWGGNNFSQLGIASAGFQDYRATPLPVVGLESGVTAVSAGPLGSMALKGDALWVWGQTGNGSASTPTPAQYPGVETGVNAIAAGGYHRVVIQNGAVKVWGRNDRYQLGQGNVTPSSLPSSSVPLMPVGLESGVTAIASGSFHSLAMKDGSVYHWGQLGTVTPGSSALIINATPQLMIDASAKISQITAGSSSSYALSSDGSYWAWGENDKGQLGTGVVGSTLTTPQHVLPPQGFKFTRIEAGAYAEHAMATLDYVTRAGDATLDGAVNFDDLLVVAQNYGLGAGSYWRRGDFNLDGATNFTDLLTLAQNYSSSAPTTVAFTPEFAGDWAQALSLVPEPAALGLLGLGFAVVPRARRVPTLVGNASCRPIDATR